MLISTHSYVHIQHKCINVIANLPSQPPAQPLKNPNEGNRSCLPLKKRGFNFIAVFPRSLRVYKIHPPVHKVSSGLYYIRQTIQTFLKLVF